MSFKYSYTPKHLTPDQIAYIDNLVEKHKALFFDKNTKKAKLKNIQADINYKVKKLVALISKVTGSIKNLTYIAKAFFPELAMEPMQYWTHYQTDLLRKDIDQKIPLFTPHRYIPHEKTRQNIEEEIHNLNQELDKYQDVANLKRGNDPDFLESIGRIHIVIFQLKVKAEFYESLFLHPDLLAEQEAELPAPKSKAGTINQQNLLMYYVLEYAKLVNPQIDKSKYAKLIQFLTGKNYDNIRKSWAKMHRHDTKTLVKDIDVICPLLEDIGAVEVLKIIDCDLRG